ncbi:Phenylalanine--tRNA ligase beta subunit,phenylalanyl-tRNA synthetase subunit beta,Phenylalanyl-tRNA synthetase beta subunit,phenylalanine--tRNA ligase, beta subunit,B3/4 domain [Chlamydia serpentis]|uniref:Phenylalanine--tRNA ligase beta subunit n=1 Tax=Chlamydia serpentis TaxID=1967782 RepID=A0A2R8FBB2_9CHLA|nr:phenylalanine--tRNA ligase subunit beta [Chlamydia serpentis]SPN73714.1 Phenylalanine--tRNA ligase beta subunit,phenylalanyl-tRNA synthetase subunit beta,Phenylalanyl-tRNA synthetase beta subunit,phenylalanine--tRNA ligase, beta subunit,B3/4 domain [Chlamydia serpentis]
MRIPLALLQTYFSEPLSTKEILKACDHIGIEADIEKRTIHPFTSVITAKILHTVPHPNADKLRIATLTDGENEYQIVCGAPNCRSGLTVPVALPGAQVLDSQGKAYTIKKSKLRGIESQGMCCGADELGLYELQVQERALLELPETTPLGEDLSTFLGNTSLDISLTPNLGHCASLLGLAREICHVTHASLVIPNEFSFADLPTRTIEIGSDSDLCPLFCYVVISGISAKPSPMKLQGFLQALNQKSINAIIDVTNYIMLSLGQPLHAYDATQIALDSLRVEKVADPECLTLLNGEAPLLPQGITIVRDNNHILGLGGVMGGKVSSFQDSTTSIVLEAAYFLPEAIRASQKLLPIQSESAYRFARGIDPQNVLPALRAAIHYILEIFPEAKISPVYCSGQMAYVLKEVPLRPITLQRILGKTFSTEVISQKLRNLGFSLTMQENIVVVTVPSYRHDIHEEVDLVEEICRTESWKIENKHPVSSYTPIYALKREIAKFLADAGLQEFFTLDLLDPETAALRRGEKEEIVLPVSKHGTVLRSSLLPGLLKSAAINLNRQAPYVQAFEVGTVYTKNGMQYQETQTLGILLTENGESLSWMPQTRALSFYSLKGWVERILYHLGLSIDTFNLDPSDFSNFHPYQQGVLKKQKQLFSTLGMVHPELTKKAQIKYPVFFAELNLDLLCKIVKKTTKHYKPYAIYPSSFRDITLTVPEDLPADTLKRKLLNEGSKWLESVTIISIYQDKSLGTGNKNVSLRLLFQDYERTLSNQDIEEEYCRLVALLNELLTDTQGTINS